MHHAETLDVEIPVTLKAGDNVTIGKIIIVYIVGNGDHMQHLVTVRDFKH